MAEYQHIVHTFEPVYDKNSRVLVLGSMPSVESRRQGFYYGYAQNRFWKVIAAITNAPVPETIEQKKSLLLKNGIAVWDVAAQCDIMFSSDASIKNVVATDLKKVTDNCTIKALFANGSTAAKLYNRLQKPILKREIITLASTSPANAAWSLQRLIDQWGAALGKYLDV